MGNERTEKKKQSKAKKRAAAGLPPSQPAEKKARPPGSSSAKRKRHDQRNPKNRYRFGDRLAYGQVLPYKLMMPLPRFQGEDSEAEVHEQVQYLAKFLARQVLRSKGGRVDKHVFEFNDGGWPELVPEPGKVGAEEFPKHCKRIIEMFCDYLETYVKHLNELEADDDADADADVKQYIAEVTELRSTLQPFVDNWDSAAQAACADVLDAFCPKDPNAIEFDEDGKPIGYDADGNAIDSDGNVIDQADDDSVESTDD